MVETKPTILIVDDEPSCRVALRIALEDEYELLEAESGEETLRILQERKDIDLVLLDYLLPPGIDGLEVLTRMKVSGYEIPVILVTGKGSEEVAVKAWRLGVRNYIIKPPKVTALLHFLDRIVPC
jgi:DNA-binding NtrC family response regulator